MKRHFLTVACMAAFLVSCGTGTDEYTISDVAVVGVDECGMETDFDLGSFTLTVDGSTVTLAYFDADGDLTELSASTDDFIETDNTIVLTGGIETVVTGLAEDGVTPLDPCTAQLADTFTVNLTDTNAKLENNETLEVQWVHDETDISEVEGACNNTDPDLWFVPLPCTSTLTFTLTQGSVLDEVL